jgi:hypothetical protein
MYLVSLRRTFGEQNVAGSYWILGREDCSVGLKAVEKRLGYCQEPNLGPSIHVLVSLLIPVASLGLVSANF